LLRGLIGDGRGGGVDDELLVGVVEAVAFDLLVGGPLEVDLGLDDDEHVLGLLEEHPNVVHVLS
jgi:hypothetical protein